MSNEILIKAANLKKYFPIKKFLGGKISYVKAVDDITMNINRRETFGLVGESGCGKSTLGRTLIRMYDITDGSLHYNNIDITNIDMSKRKDLQNKMQIIFQDTYSAVNPFWNVEEILSEPLKQISIPKNERKERMLYLLNKVGLQKDDLLKFPYEFSGGQRQRIGIARALTTNPEFIMCDEPIAALDVSIQAQVVNMLEDLQSELGLTYLFVAHDLSMVKYISTRIGVMYLGNLVETAKSDDLYKNPLHPYTQTLLSAIPIPDPKLARQTKHRKLLGDLPNPMDKFIGCKFAPRCAYKTEICTQILPTLREIESSHFVACHNAEKIN